MKTPKKLLSLALALAFSSAAWAQQPGPGELKDPKATAILDQMSATLASFPTIVVQFTQTLENLQTDEQTIEEGVMYIKGEHYKMFFMGNELFFDGQTRAVFNIESSEVTYYDGQEKSQDAIEPTDLLSIYKEGYKYQFIQTVQADGRTLDEIELYPEQIDGKSYSKVAVWVDQQSHLPHVMKYFGKDGVNFYVKIDYWQHDMHIDDRLFRFNEQTHPNVEVIDLRF